MAVIAGGGKRKPSKKSTSIPGAAKNLNARLDRNLKALNAELRGDIRTRNNQSSASLNGPNGIIARTMAAQAGRTPPAPPRSYRRKGKPNSANPRSDMNVNQGKGYKAPPKKVVAGRPAPARSGSDGRMVKPPVIATTARAATPAGRPVNVGGRAETINSKGIINTPGSPNYGKYPAQVDSKIKAAENSKRANTPVGTGGPGKPAAAGANPWDKYIAEAGNSVNAELLPLINELKRAHDEATLQHGKALGDTASRGAREQANVAELYARLNNFTGNIQNTQNRTMDQLGAQGGDVYAQLARQLNSGFDASQQKVSDEVARMGLTAAAPGVNAASERDQSYLTGLANVDRQAFMSGMDQQQSGFNALMDLTRNNAATESFSRQATTQRETNADIADLWEQLQSQTRELSGQRGDIEATRGAKIQEMARALEEAAYSRRVEAEQRAFQNRMAEQQFGLEKQQVNASLQPQPMSELDYMKAYNEYMKLQAEAMPPSYGPAPGTLPAPKDPGRPNSSNPRSPNADRRRR